MKKLLLLVVILTCISGYSQEKTTFTDELSDGWYQTYGVSRSEARSLKIKQVEWVYVSKGVITSVGHKNKARNITDSLEQSLNGTSLYKTSIAYIGGGHLKRKVFNDEVFFVAEITFSGRTITKSTNIKYYSIKI